MEFDEWEGDLSEDAVWRCKGRTTRNWLMTCKGRGTLLPVKRWIAPNHRSSAGSSSKSRPLDRPRQHGPTLQKRLQKSASEKSVGEKRRSGNAGRLVRAHAWHHR